MSTDQAAGTRTEELLSLAERYAAHNYHPLPVVIAEAEGAWVTDVDGNRYLDMLAAYSALNFGHRHPRLVEAAHRQIDRLTALMTLLEGHADPNQSTAGAGTALRVALIEGQIEIIRILLAHGATPNAILDNTSVLQRALVERRDDIARLLIDAGANVNFSTRVSAPPLFIAADTQNDALVEVLLRAGADPNAAYQDRFTPLMAARRYSNQKIASLLLSHGATH